jgi:subtilisin family serine protease
VKLGRVLFISLGLALALSLFKLVGAESPFVPGKVVVKIRPGIAEPALQALLGREAKIVGEIAPLRVKVLSVPPGKEREWIERLRASPIVEYAEPVRFVRALFVPNDPYWAYQWNMNLIKAPQAWDIITGTSSVTVAIIDTGVDLDHPEFSGRIVSGWDFVNNDAYPDDDHWHGTHVAGIAGAQGNNGRGVAGVAWNVKIMPLKVLDSSGNGYDTDVAAAIIWAADRGVKVLNMSLGADESSSVLADAVDYAYRKGCLMVAAAGNEGANRVLYPAAYTQVIAVSAVNYYSGIAYYSNYGPEIEVAAPGGDGSYRVLSTVPGWYGYAAGTSMATPHVAGLAALLWSANPSLTAAQVRYCITSTAVDLGEPGRDWYYGYGVIDAAEALKAKLRLNPASISFLADSSGFVGPYTATVSVENPRCVPLSWTVRLSSTGWLTFSAVGGPLYQGTTGAIRITATLPATFGFYSGQILVTGTAIGGQVVTGTVTVTLTYLKELFKVFLPLVLKG